MKYVKAEIEVQLFQNEDVIAASCKNHGHEMGYGCTETSGKHQKGEAQGFMLANPVATPKVDEMQLPHMPYDK